ncbi:hypothetical protein [Garciella nitratireducens]|uniref:Uncharacterized protein n=1 Tax=Garciella nitratireducens DSM 15102 TaxID=1121911 RepID=A0A1T4N332_9FIRM|nr:hypothetical protein [Garciella nitratireducens]RBP42700.1 hypothetical protein DFR81_10817 [Garciella nitratireducens]SJZ73435.1 hypothetical protein SAMN02745973_01530 [Garciella nitratireducens DSM 15102]
MNTSMVKEVAKQKNNKFYFTFFSWGYFYGAGALFCKKIKEFLSHESSKIIFLEKRIN